jgi:hypothetical protein
MEIQISARTQRPYCNRLHKFTAFLISNNMLNSITETPVCISAIGFRLLKMIQKKAVNQFG